MPATYAMCPFSHSPCKECAIYRGRHCYSIPSRGRSRAVVRKETVEWTENFTSFSATEDGEAFLYSINWYG
jgi:hypothetical protein